MRESFVFYASFAEALKELPDKARLKIYDAIMAYALQGEDTEFTGIEKAVFSLIKPQIKANHQRYENGCKGAEFGSRGGRPKKPQEGIEEKPQENPKKTPKKPQENPKKTPNENENVNVNDISPLCISPQGDKNKDFETLFFEKYPKYAKSKGKHTDIDFEKLLKEFEKSSYLRTLYTFKQVVEIYDAILKGDYRDKETATSGADAKAERERWYAKRKDIAMSKQEAILEKLCKRKDFFEVKGRLAQLEIEIAKAQCADDMRAEECLTAEYEDLLEARHEILRKCGYTEADLEPRWHCEKCGDTGFMADGRMCDCYEVER